jgi:hypothetical protein
MHEEENEEPMTWDGEVELITDNGKWFTIEKSGVEKRSEMRMHPNGYGHLWLSTLVSDACVEGSAVQMRAIARAIRSRGGFSARRCAVDATGDRVLLCSPRNSRRDGSVTHEAAEKLATQIEEQLRPWPLKTH